MPSRFTELRCYDNGKLEIVQHRPAADPNTAYRGCNYLPGGCWIWTSGEYLPEQKERAVTAFLEMINGG